MFFPSCDNIHHDLITTFEVDEMVGKVINFISLERNINFP